MLARKRKLQKGFTLVELLVTLTIFVILTGVVLFSQSKFNGTILLTNLAYDTALTVREAQTYGINIKGFSGTNQFLPYGVHFEEMTKSFILFADQDYSDEEDPGTGIFSGSTSTCKTSDGCVSRYSIKRGNYISNLYADNDGDCSDEKTKLNITFIRPNPDAIIKADDDPNTTYGRACIELSGTDGSKRTVVVQSNGLIEIKNP
jgi:prepilin-type N-terminal cleavage/methylation domain-containing protein